MSILWISTRTLIAHHQPWPVFFVRLSRKFCICNHDLSRKTTHTHQRDGKTSQRVPGFRGGHALFWPVLLATFGGVNKPRWMDRATWQSISTTEHHETYYAPLHPHTFYKTSGCQFHPFRILRDRPSNTTRRSNETLANIVIDTERNKTLFIIHYLDL